MGFMDKLKQKAQEYDLQAKADKLAEGIEKTSKQAAEKAGELAHENRAKVASGLDKAGAKFDAQTDGKYTDKVAKAKGLAVKAVDKVADQRPGTATETPSATGATGATTGATPATSAPSPDPFDLTPGTYGTHDAASTPASTTPDYVKKTPPADAGPSGATPPPGPQDPAI